MAQKIKKEREENKIVKLLTQIRDLQILLLLKSGVSSDEVNYATSQGAANIRAKFPVKRGRKKTERKP